MAKTAAQILESAGFKKIVKDRWVMAFALTAVQFVLYYGYILLVAMNKPFLAQKIGKVTTIGIPMVVMVIVLSWVLTLIYVTWANNKYDPEVAAMNEQLKGGKK